MPSGRACATACPSSSRVRRSVCCSARWPSRTASRLGEAVLMSATVYGGASQMVGIELFGQKIAPWLIVLSIFAVNFRHVLYSAALGRAHRSLASSLQRAVAFFLLIDPQFAEAERRQEAGNRLSFAWYFGLGLPIWVDLGRRDGDRRLFRRPDRRPACAWSRLPAADLFPRPGDELPRAAALAAGRRWRQGSLRFSPSATSARPGTSRSAPPPASRSPPFSRRPARAGKP